MNACIQLIKKEVYRFSSIWVQTIIGPVSTAILYQLIFGKQLEHVILGSTSYQEFLIPGLVMMQVLLNAFGNGSSSLIQSKYTGNIIFILMAPISPLSMYLGYLTASIIRGILVGVVVFASIVWFGGEVPKVWSAVIFFSLCGAAIAAGLGLIAGILSDKFDQLAAFQSFVIVPLVYLAGIFFTIDGLPHLWWHVAHLDPFLYIVDGFRYGFTMYTSINVYVCGVIVASMAMIVNLVGYMLLKHGIKIKH